MERFLSASAKETDKVLPSSTSSHARPVFVDLLLAVTVSGQGVHDKHRKSTHHHTETRHDACVTSTSICVNEEGTLYMYHEKLACSSFDFPVPCSTGESKACRRIIASIPSVFPRMHSSGHRSQTTSPSHSSHTARMNLAAPGGVRTSPALCFAFVVIGDQRTTKEMQQRWIRAARQKPSRGADRQRVQRPKMFDVLKTIIFLLLYPTNDVGLGKKTFPRYLKTAERP